MNKVGTLLLVVVLLSVIAVASAGAAGTPASKVTAVVKDITVLNGASNPTDWKPVMTKQLKTANQKDLFIDVSLECGLYTYTKIATKQPVGTDTATAGAGVNVRVVIDPGTDQEVVALPNIPTVLDDPNTPVDESDPGGVTFCRRIQTLSGQLGQALSCTGPTLDTCTLVDQWVSLALDTMDANSFNYIAPNVGVGLHTIQIQARIDPLTATVTDVSKAAATLGWGSVTVEEVRMAKGDDPLMDMTQQ